MYVISEVICQSPCCKIELQVFDIFMYFDVFWPNNAIISFSNFDLKHVKISK